MTNDSTAARQLEPGVFIGPEGEAERLWNKLERQIARVENSQIFHVNHCTYAINAMDQKDAVDAKAEERLARTLHNLHRDVVILEWWLGKHGQAKLRDQVERGELSDRDIDIQNLARIRSLIDMKIAIDKITPQLQQIRHTRRLRAGARDRVLASMARAHQRRAARKQPRIVCRPATPRRTTVRARRVQRTTARRMAAKALGDPDSSSDPDSSRLISSSGGAA